jgi:flagellar hook capping protein FlgD
MRRRASTVRLSVAVAFFMGLVTCGAAWSQPDTVLTHQKISDTEGFFSSVLDSADELGGAVASLGDLDGAGPSVVALAVGASQDDDGGLNRGAVHVLFLSSTGTVLSSQKISDTAGNFSAPIADEDEFGSSLAYLGDLDGAGPSVAALAVGAIGVDDGSDNYGAVYVLFLGSAGTVLSWQKIGNTHPVFAGQLRNGDEFGTSVTSLGDLDGPGANAVALAVGAAGDNDGDSDRGAVYVMFLNSAGNLVSYQTISDTQGNFNYSLANYDHFGNSIAALGDLDGAGPSVAALAVGAPGDDGLGFDRGCVYVLFLTSAGAILSSQEISESLGNFSQSLEDSDEFGNSLAHLEDPDGAGPGTAALVVGATGDDDGGVGGGAERGAVYVLYPSSTGTVVSHHKISGTVGNFHGTLDDGDSFGSAMAGLGDLDGPGGSARTLVVGAVGDDDGGVTPLADHGAVYVLFLAGPSTIGVPGPFTAGLENVLGRAHPNPFHPRTTIHFRNAEAGRVEIAFWDIQGRLVRKLVHENAPPGDHAMVWDGRDDTGQQVEAGIYFYRMSVNGRGLGAAQRAVRLR